MEEAYDPKLTVETIEKILGPARLERDKYEDNEGSWRSYWIGVDECRRRYSVYRICLIER